MHGSTHCLLDIAPWRVADPVRPQILTPVPGTGTNSVFHCGGLTVSGLGVEEGHQRAPGEFLPALAEMFSCDITLVCMCHKHLGCKVSKALALRWQNTYASLTVSHALSPRPHNELVSQTRHPKVCSS